MVGNGHCFVPGCKTGYTSDRKKCKIEGKKTYSLFAPPRGADIEKWRKAIPRSDRELSHNDRVCALHFEGKDIEQYFVTRLTDGTIHEIERERPLLKKDAIPVLFPNSPGYFSRTHSKKTSSSENAVEKLKIENVVSVPQDSDYSSSGIEEQNRSISNYDDVVSNIKNVRLPSEWWAVNNTDSFTIFVKWNKVYLPERRIVIEKNMKVKVFIHHIEVALEDKVINCTEDMQALVSEVDGYIVCAGTHDKSNIRCCGILQRKSLEGRCGMYCKKCQLSRMDKKRKFKQNLNKILLHKRKQVDISQKLECAYRKNSQLKVKVACLSHMIKLAKKKNSGLFKEN